MTKPNVPRRNFTKSVAAALISAPLAPSSLNAAALNAQKQREEPRKPGTQQTEQQRRAAGQRTRHEHIPPMGIGSGSFYLELYHRLERQTDVATSPRPQRYRAHDEAGKRYGAIYRIQVLTELEGEYQSRDYYFPEKIRAQLRLWFQNWNGTGFDSLDNEPNAVIKGGDGPDNNQLLIEIEKAGGNNDTLQDDSTHHHKANRKQKYKHKGHAQDFRIGRWQIADSGGTAFPDLEESGNDGYQFLVSFYNPDHV